MGAQIEITSTVFDEFRRLSADPDVHRGIDLLESEQLPRQEARMLAEQIWRVIRPQIPEFTTYTKNSYWWQLSTMNAHWSLIPGSQKRDQVARWMRENFHRSHGKDLYTRAIQVPQPRTGK